jgi:hypothetical protein
VSEHEAVHEATTEAPARDGGARQPGAPVLRGAAAHAIALQRSAGNRAVVHALRPASLRLARRRIPGRDDLGEILTDPAKGGGRVSAPDQAAHEAGLDRLLAFAGTELSAEQQGKLLAAAGKRHSFWEWLALPVMEAKLELVEELEKVNPASKLGDPRLIDTGPRKGSDDAANIKRLVRNARKVFDAIAGGRRDSDLADVFGARNVKQAKLKYASARTWMDIIAGRGRVITDRSGYNTEVSLGGLTDSFKQISVRPDVIDDPDAPKSVVTMIHEAMHAGNQDVRDKGYKERDEFPKASAVTKLTNAAHYEVVAWRIVDPDSKWAFKGKVFVPAGSKSTPALTQHEQAASDAYNLFRKAWTIGLNLHTLWVQVQKSPRQWDGLDLSAQFGTTLRGRTFSTVMPYWSKVEKLTVHERTHISSKSKDPSTQPVTLIDVALSESVTRRLMKAMKAVPQDDAAIQAYEKANASPAEIAAADDAAKERDLLVRIVLRQYGASVTGSVDRDMRVVRAMGTIGDTWPEVLAVRSPADFPD